MLLERPITTPEELNQRNKDIDALCRRFIDAATPIVKELVRERFLPGDKQSIKAVDVGMSFCCSTSLTFVQVELQVSIFTAVH